MHTSGASSCCAGTLEQLNQAQGALLCMFAELTEWSRGQVGVVPRATNIFLQIQSPKPNCVKILVAPQDGLQPKWVPVRVEWRIGYLRIAHAERSRKHTFAEGGAVRGGSGSCCRCFGGVLFGLKTFRAAVDLGQSGLQGCNRTSKASS